MGSVLFLPNRNVGVTDRYSNRVLSIDDITVRSLLVRERIRISFLLVTISLKG